MTSDIEVLRHAANVGFVAHDSLAGTCPVAGKSAVDRHEHWLKVAAAILAAAQGLDVSEVYAYWWAGVER